MGRGGVLRCQAVVLWRLFIRILHSYSTIHRTRETFPLSILRVPTRLGALNVLYNSGIPST